MLNLSIQIIIFPRTTQIFLSPPFLVIIISQILYDHYIEQGIFPFIFEYRRQSFFNTIFHQSQFLPISPLYSRTREKMFLLRSSEVSPGETLIDGGVNDNLVRRVKKYNMNNVITFEEEERHNPESLKASIEVMDRHRPGVCTNLALP